MFGNIFKPKIVKVVRENALSSVVEQIGEFDTFQSTGKDRKKPYKKEMLEKAEQKRQMRRDKRRHR